MSAHIDLRETQFVYSFHSWILTRYEAGKVTVHDLANQHLGEAPPSHPGPFWAVYQLNLFNNEG